MAEVAVAAADGDGAAGVATGGVELEAGELSALDGGAVAAGSELGRGGVAVAVSISVSVGVAIAVVVAVAVGELCRGLRLEA